jgi:hypothetical protein
MQFINDGTNGRSLGNQIAPVTNFVNSPMVWAYIATASHTSACRSFVEGQIFTSYVRRWMLGKFRTRD